MMERSFDAAFQIFANQAMEGLLRRLPALAAHVVKPARSYGDMTDFIAQYDGQQGGSLVVAHRAQTFYHAWGDVKAACLQYPRRRRRPRRRGGGRRRRRRPGAGGGGGGAGGGAGRPRPRGRRGGV